MTLNRFVSSTDIRRILGIVCTVYFLILLNPEPLAAGEERPSWAGEPGENLKITGMVMPHQEVVLGPGTTGRIAHTQVVLGQRVAKGTLMMSLEDEIQQARVEAAQIEADTTVDMDLTQVRINTLKKELVRLEELGQHASEQVVENARCELEIAILEHAKAKINHAKAVKNYELEKLRLKDLKIFAPFTGDVTEILKRAGESVDEKEGVIAFVQLDPLEVLLDVPLQWAGTIHSGDQVKVIPTDRQWKSRTGKVTFVNPVLNPASQTFRVRLQVPNQERGWMAGMKVIVAFHEKNLLMNTKETQPATKDVSHKDTLISNLKSAQPPTKKELTDDQGQQ